jgi:hypothetical protein
MLQSGKIFLPRDGLLNVRQVVAGARLWIVEVPVFTAKSGRGPSCFQQTVAILIAESITGFQTKNCSSNYK